MGPTITKKILCSIVIALCKEENMMAGSIKEVYVSHRTILPGTKMWPRTIFQKIFKNELKHILYLTSKGGATYNEKKTIFRNSLTTEAR